METNLYKNDTNKNVAVIIKDYNGDDDILSLLAKRKVMQEFSDMVKQNDPSFANITEINNYIDNSALDEIFESIVKTNGVELDCKGIAGALYEHYLSAKLHNFYTSQIRIDLTNKEQEYFKNKGIKETNLIGEILEKSLDYIRKGNYTEMLSLTETEDYELPAILCLMSFAKEEEFLKQIKEEQILQLIDPTSNDFFTDPFNRTLLHYAAFKNKTKIIEQFCELLGDKSSSLMEHKCDFGRTAMHSAASVGQKEALQTLEEKDQSHEVIKLRDNYGRTILHLASSGGHINIVEDFHNDELVLMTDNYGRTILHLAAYGNHTNIIEAFADHELINKPDDYGRNILHLAALNNASDVVEFLQKRGCFSLDSRDKENRTPLHLAAKANNCEVVKLLLEKDQSLLKEKDSEGNNALHLAAKCGSYDVLKQFIQYDSSIIDETNQHGSTALHHAVYERHLNVLNLLIKNGADVTLKDSDNRTPLMLALKKNPNPRTGEDNLKSIIVNLANHDYNPFICKGWGKKRIFGKDNFEKEKHKNYVDSEAIKVFQDIADFLSRQKTVKHWYHHENINMILGLIRL